MPYRELTPEESTKVYREISPDAKLDREEQITAKQSGVFRGAEVTASGANRGISGLVGLPADIMNKALSLAGLGTDQPVMGSQWIEQNIMPTRIEPKGLLENILSATGEQIPSLLPGVGMASKVSPFMNALGQAARVGIPAGVASGVTRTVTDNPYADMAAQLVGGMAGGMTIPRSKSVGQIEQQTNKIIDRGIEKGVRPSVVGKSTEPQLQAYMKRAEEGVKTIVDNKPNLKLVNENGEVVNKLPENLREFSQAIDQTKAKIFEEYDQMAKQASQTITGTAGGQNFGFKVWVDLKPISDELNIIAKNKVLKDLSPNVAEYAKAKADALRASKGYTAKEAQEAIAHLNEKLNAYYKNPTYQNASLAGIDAMIVNRIRRNLDDMIEFSVGEGYQGLKNKYGALKAIEKDTVHRAVVDARKNIKGFFDLTDVFSGEQVLRGVLTMNPVNIATGVGMRGIKSYIKWINEPNRIVKEMFSKASKSMAEKPTISNRGVMIGSEALKQLEE